MEKAKLVITCANCNNEGHYARDCSEPRKTGKRGCKNCGNDGHIAKECPEPQNMDNVTCKECNESQLPSPTLHHPHTVDVAC